MIVFPAIDLRDGKCVRLVQGRKEDMTIYSNDPAGMAIYWADQGAQWLHVVDLDGAFEGRPRNLDKLAAIVKAVDVKVQFGGGMRTLDDVGRALDTGAERVIIGTRAVEDPEFLLFLLNELGPEKVVLGLDAINGMVALEGWEKKSEIGAVEFAQTAARLGATTAIYTDIARDGLLQGPNFVGVERMTEQSGLSIIASGGIAGLDDIRRLKSIGVEGAITGKAIYEGRLQLKEALAAAGEQLC